MNITLNMVKNVSVCDGVVKVHVELTTPACPMKGTIESDVTNAVKRLEGVTSVELATVGQAVASVLHQLLIRRC